MLDWIFKKTSTPAVIPPTAVPPKVATPRAAAIDWAPALQAAMGDDAALLALAVGTGSVKGGAPVDVKLAAIEAIGSEALLKSAERELRQHDRRVHRLAKQCHQAAVAQREARERAGRLIDAAAALRLEALIPTNRLVELDRDWQALPPALVDEAQREAYGEHMATLGAMTRERGDATLQAERWKQAARAALAELRSACAEAASGGRERSQLFDAGAAAIHLVDAAPPSGDAALREALQAAVLIGTELHKRLVLLDELLAPENTQDNTQESAAELWRRWQQLAPLADAALAGVLAQRVDQWQRLRDDAKAARRGQQRAQARDVQRAQRDDLAQVLESAVTQAEAALAAGHLAEAHTHLMAIDAALGDGAPVATLGGRIDAVQAQYAQLKGWQHWGGGLARDELVLQAEALAAAAGGAADTRTLTLPVKLTITQQAELIDEMRARWKELDRLGGATSRALWRRFDEALKTAWQPVGAQRDTQRAAREQNLQARVQLLEALDAVAAPQPDEATTADTAAPDTAARDWKPITSALDRFHTEWRKLGPPEHTVPRQARDALFARMNAAVARLDEPLAAARRGAQLAREQLVARARTLADAGSRDAIGSLRTLQAEWQQQARALPLARAAEAALWAEFKAAIDAVYGARDAAFDAREAEFKAFGVQRLAIVERLEALSAETPAAELRRTLAETEAQWQRLGPAPRSEAAALESRCRRAVDAAREHLAGSARRQWHQSCDAYAARLALCPAVEPGERGDAGTDTLLLQLETTLDLPSPTEWQAARRELKLRALKAALEGRPNAAETPAGWEPQLAVLLDSLPIDETQRARLAAVLAALRERGPAEPRR